MAHKRGKAEKRQQEMEEKLKSRTGRTVMEIGQYRGVTMMTYKRESMRLSDIEKAVEQCASVGIKLIPVPFKMDNAWPSPEFHPLPRTN